MADRNKFEKLLELGYIRKVRTRNRMIKNAAYGWILYDMANNLKGKVSEVYAVDDCDKSGVIVDAIEAGNLTARKV